MRQSLKQIAYKYGICFADGRVTVPNFEYVLETVPEFRQLAEKTTTSRWHQERNMMLHTKMVCTAMADLLNSTDTVSENEKLCSMFAALFHDLGKCRCENSDDGKLLSNGHPAISERLCRKILWTMDVEWRERICEIVRWHDLYCSSDISDKKLISKISKLSPWLFLHIELLEMMFLADDHGSIKPEELEGSARKMCDRIENLYNTTEFHITRPINGFGEFTVFVMCGLPGSGKSTWVKENYPDLPLVSRDLIREKLGMTKVGVKFVGTSEQESEVSKVSDEMVETFCKQKQSFIYDNMNTREKYRKPFLDIVNRYHPVVRFVWVEVEDIKVLESRRPEISHQVFDSMVENIEFPRPYEYDTMTVLQDWSVSEHFKSVLEYGYLHIQEYKSKQTKSDGKD